MYPSPFRPAHPKSPMPSVAGVVVPPVEIDGAGNDSDGSQAPGATAVSSGTRVTGADVADVAGSSLEHAPSPSTSPRPTRASTESAGKVVPPIRDRLRPRATWVRWWDCTASTVLAAPVRS